MYNHVKQSTENNTRYALLKFTMEYPPWPENIDDEDNNTDDDDEFWSRYRSEKINYFRPSKILYSFTLYRNSEIFGEPIEGSFENTLPPERLFD